MALLFSAQKSQAQRSALEFVRNEGQWQAGFLYKGYSSQADIYLESGGITYVVGEAANLSKMEAVKEHPETAEKGVVLNYHAYRMKWIGGNPRPETSVSKKSRHYYNYFLGTDTSNWKSDLFGYGHVDYKEVYPHIDFHISSDKGLPKYDFIVKPGGDPAQIRLEYEGVAAPTIKDNRLQIQTSVGLIQEMAPYAFQYIEGVFTEVACDYVRYADGTVGYDFPDGYDEHNTLTIDPVIVFASLTGSTADNWGFTATYDAQGNLYAGGITNGLGYPVSIGAFQVTFGGGSGSTMPCDVTISKFNSAGTDLIYSTYLGGNGDDMPHSLIVDHAGNLIVAGKTLSSDFPTTSGAYDPNHNGGYDIFLTKFNASGTALSASTYLGGSEDDGVNVSATFTAMQTTLKYNYGDGSRSEVIVDRQDNIYLAGSTRSTNFPLRGIPAKSTLGGEQDGVVVKFNSGLSNLIYSTYLGGSADDAAYVLALDTAESHLYVGGGTMSSNFHLSTTAGAWQPSYQSGLADGFICRFVNGGNYDLLRTTFIGTNGYDQVYGLQTDLENGVYAMGQTLGAFPVSPSTVYSNPGSPQFLIKLDSTLSTSIYSTVFGSGNSTQPNISPVAFLVDTCQNVYISGWAAESISAGTSTNGLPFTNDAFQSTTDGSDFYFIVFNKNAQDLLFASFFGASGKSEHVDGGTSRFNPQGEVYQAICASCGSGQGFPATSNAYATTKGSSNCNLGALKIAFNLGAVNADADAVPSTAGCVPFSVQFDNNSSNATAYAWDFGDGSPVSSSTSPSHTYTSSGTYTVRLIATNPNACMERDTTYLTIQVSSDTIHADFDFVLADTCTDPKVTFTNTSTPLPGQSLTDAGYTWFFGDGNSYTGAQPPVHRYAGAGVYDIMLIMTSDSACNSPDTVIKQLIISQENVTAGFDLPDSICVGDSLLFSNTSTNARSYLWAFGNGASSTDANPVYPYSEPGTYTIVLIARNPESCNKADTLSRVITVAPSPVAQFMVTPLQAETNQPFDFHNQSQDALRYVWNFGDGQSSTEENPRHQYMKTGNYTVCLTAYNAAGCPDKICKTIYADVLPLADLPDAFSPNGDGSNDILYVRGYGIRTMDLKVFNRWGELVFSSTDQSIGWDGTYKGSPQEMDAYAYILEVNFWDGKHFVKKGNVTLIR